MAGICPAMNPLLKTHVKDVDIVEPDVAEILATYDEETRS